MDLDQLFTQVVNDAKGDLKAIIIFNLKNGLPLYHNIELKESDPPLYNALFSGKGDASGEAIQGFDALSGIQDALNQFGEQTRFGELTSSIFNLSSGKMIVDFLEIDIPLAICLIMPERVNLGRAVRQYDRNIVKIKEALLEI
ncbi:MAG: hypothetical protein F6K35_32085 [Okeania sp. SIO2H7]|nr:hypothetical protein [Okeania sp. SIO2H7]